MKLIKHIFKIYLLPFLAFTLSSSFFMPVEKLQIRIFAHLKLSSVQVIINKGNYRFIADGNIVNEMKLNDVFLFALSGDSLLVKKNDSLFGKYKYVKFVCNSESELKVKSVDPDRKIRTYQDNISINVSETYLRLINEVDMDNYIAGVTEAEAGSRAGIEFYKVQAILARTFALAHINKHISLNV